MAAGGLQMTQALEPDCLVRGLCPPLSSCATLGKLRNLPVPQFPPL